MPTFALSLRDELLDQLRHRIRALEEGEAIARDGTVCSTGAAALDRLLPAGGLRRGSLVEWLADGPGTGASTLALLAAREACGTAGTLLILDRQKACYPPALAAWGIDLARALVVWPQNQADEGWAVDQALRSSAVAAVWGHFERLDSKMFRRWQLAAETSGAIGLLLRPASLRGQPTWADVQLAIEPRAAPLGLESRRLRVEVVRCRGGAGGGYVDLELDETTGAAREIVRHETLFVHRPAELADPTPRRRSTGA
jgi:protein ImuA